LSFRLIVLFNLIRYDGTWRDADPALVAEKVSENAPHTVRFKIPPGKVVSIDDKVGRVDIYNIYHIYYLTHLIHIPSNMHLYHLT
jgi:glutamyl/glutaminyl-tRNA synthetase